MIGAILKAFSSLISGYISILVKRLWMKFWFFLLMLFGGINLQAQQTCECVAEIFDETGNLVLTIDPTGAWLFPESADGEYNVQDLCFTGPALDKIKQFVLPGTGLEFTKLLGIKCCNVKRLASFAGISTAVAIKLNTTLPYIHFDQDRRIVLTNDCIHLYNLKFE